MNIEDSPFIIIRNCRKRQPLSELSIPESNSYRQNNSPKEARVFLSPLRDSNEK